MQALKDVLSLIRIGNSLVIGLAAVTGYVVCNSLDYKTMILLFLSASLIGCYGNIINDIYDIEIDRINKPWRPLPSGRISIKKAWSLALSAATIGVILSLLISLKNTLIALVAVYLLYTYSKKIKRKGFLGNILIAILSLLVILYGGLATNIPWKSLVPGLYAFLVITGREVLKGLEDIEGDKKHGINTIAVMYGEKTAINIGMIPLITLVIISPLPYILMNMNVLYLITAILGVDIPIIISLILINKDPRGKSWTATRILKIPLLAGLIAFILGVIP